MKVSKLALVVAGTILAVVVGCNMLDVGEQAEHRRGDNFSLGGGSDGDSFTGSIQPLEADEILDQLEKDYDTPNDAKEYDFYLHQAARIMASLFYREMSPTQMVVLFRDTGIEPFFMKSEHRGSFHSMLRTKRSWPGAYNIEGNFSGPSYENMQLDNFRFQYNSPTEQSFAEAEEALDEAFGGLGYSYEESVDHRAWELPDGYFLSIRYLTDQEIRLGDVYNTYTEADRGSVVITVFRPNSSH
ncbi:MAG: hypothetical protein HRT45_07075 [Bdellovibrionales bacterium]|nr:hypothetical protein [Bdellovibrionales bacterium]